MLHKTKTYDNMSPQEVECPRWIQKRMRANLAAAAKTKVNLDRAGIARAILENTRAKPKVQAPTMAARSDSLKPAAAVPVVQTVLPDIRTVRPKLWSMAKAGFCKIARHISGVLPAKRLPRLACHKG